jgi:hypothetical protein
MTLMGTAGYAPTVSYARVADAEARSPPRALTAHRVGLGLDFTGAPRRLCRGSCFARSSKLQRRARASRRTMAKDGFDRPRSTACRVKTEVCACSASASCVSPRVLRHRFRFAARLSSACRSSVE